MNDTDVSDVAIRLAFKQLTLELSKRYGLEGGCTRMQLLATVNDLEIPPATFPYLGYEFLTDDEYAALRASESTRDWVAIEMRAELVFRDLVHVQRLHDGFRENWIGINGR